MTDKVFKSAAAASPSYELFNPLDLYAFEYDTKLQQNVPRMSALSWLKAIKGRTGKRKVKRSQYSYYEEGQFMKASAKIASVAVNGSKYNITLSATDHSDIGGSGASSFPVENMYCMFQDGKTHGFVESVNRTTAGAHYVVVKPINASQNIASVALADSTIVFYTNGQPERGSKTEARVPQFEKITNTIQIVREYYDTSDVEVQNQIWFEAPSTGKRYLYYKGIEDTMERFEFQKEAALLLAPPANNLTDKNNKKINGAYGLIPQIDDNGITMEYYNSPDSDSFDQMILALDNNYADKKYFVGHGIDLGLKLKDFLVKFAQNGTGNISFSPFDGGQQQAINLNFKSYSVGQYEFYFNQWDVFSHKDSLGAPGLPYRHMGVFIPAGVTKNPDPANTGSAYVPYLQLISPEWGVPINSNIDKGEYLMWETGALASQGPTNDVLEAGVHMVAYIGFEVRCRHKFAKWEAA